MSSNVDLRELAIEREASASSSVRDRRHVWTRYVIPLLLMFGFVCLVGWASRDTIFPSRQVTVVPVFSTSSEVQEVGTPLFKAAGWIEPRPTPIRIAALAPGVIERLLVVEDQEVSKGEPIAELVKADATLARDRALADLELREAELEESLGSLSAAKTRFEQPVHLEAALGEAQALLGKVDTSIENLPFELQRAELEYEALKTDYEGKLAAGGIITRTALEVARTKADAARALVKELEHRKESLNQERSALVQRRDALQTQLDLLADERRELAESEAQVRAAKARVEQARVSVAEAELRCTRMTVVAPVDGRIFRLIAAPGARIGSGMTHMEGHDGSTVVTMYQPEMLQVRVDVRFEDIPQVSIGQTVEIDNPALEQPLVGRVLFVSSEADIQKNTLQVKVEIPNPPEVFKPEMLVDVTFVASKPSGRTDQVRQESRLYVLRQLVHQDGDTSFVWLADQSDGVARKTVVELGARGSSGLVEVTKGLSISSRLIASGTEGLSDGDRIEVTAEHATMGVEPIDQ